MTFPFKAFQQKPEGKIGENAQWLSPSAECLWAGGGGSAVEKKRASRGLLAPPPIPRLAGKGVQTAYGRVCKTRRRRAIHCLPSPLPRKGGVTQAPWDESLQPQLQQGLITKRFVPPRTRVGQMIHGSEAYVTVPPADGDGLRKGRTPCRP